MERGCGTLMGKCNKSHGMVNPWNTRLIFSSRKLISNLSMWKWKSNYYCCSLPLSKISPFLHFLFFFLLKSYWICTNIYPYVWGECMHNDKIWGFLKPMSIMIIQVMRSACDWMDSRWMSWWIWKIHEESRTLSKSVELSRAFFANYK